MPESVYLANILDLPDPDEAYAVMMEDRAQQEWIDDRLYEAERRAECPARLETYEKYYGGAVCL